MQLLTMFIDIAQVSGDDNGLGSQLTMVLRVLQCVKGYELIGHDATSAINHPMLLQGIALQRVGKVDTICRHQLTTLQAVEHVLRIIFLVAFLIGFLDAAARGRIVVGNGETNHRTVRQVDRALYQALAKGATSHNDAAVVVLNST